MTPDSFSDGGAFVTVNPDRSETIDVDRAVAAAEQMFADGATYVDVGGESTRPHATPLNSDQEIPRVEGVLQRLIPAHPGKISVDSYHPETIQHFADQQLGEFIINDVTGFNNGMMVKVAADTGFPIICSQFPSPNFSYIPLVHQGDMLDNFQAVVRDLKIMEEKLLDAGIPPEKMWFDPGIGFGKTMELNNQLVEFAFYVPEWRVVIGYSRKRFLGDDRMEPEPNLAAAKRAIDNGAAILRVHDVKAHADFLQQANQSSS